MYTLVGSVDVTDAVEAAFSHVKDKYPDTFYLIVDVDGQWLYLMESFDSPEFDETIDDDILQKAVDSLIRLPAIFHLVED